MDTPTQVVICRYRGSSVLQLTGSRRVRFGLATVGRELAWLPRNTGGPRTCTAIGGRHTPYLLGLRYPSGVLWVTTAYDVNGCEVTSNGAFTSDTYVGNDVDHAFKTGVWSGGAGSNDGGPCLAWPVGRLGQDRQLVPPGATGLTICSANASPSTSTTVHVTRDFTALVSALDHVATRTTSNMCDPHGDEPVAYTARFDYSEGPSVVVDIRKNCEPKLSNRSVDADGSAQIWRMVEDMARRPG